MQEFDVHLNHVDETRNIFTDALSKIPRLDDIKAYDCNNKKPVTKLCCTMDNEIPSSQSFALDLLNITEKNQPYFLYSYHKCNK